MCVPCPSLPLKLSLALGATWIVAAGCASKAREVTSRFDPASDTVLVGFRDSTQTCGTAWYPPSMWVQSVEGRVLLTVFVDSSGMAHRDSLRVLSATDSAFVPPAVDFVLACRYTVPRLNGRAMPSQMTIPVTFTMQGAGRVMHPGRRPQRP